MSKESTKTFNQFAVSLGMMVIILTVIYSSEKYDIWDLFVGIGLLWLIKNFRNQLVTDINNLWLARIGFAIASAVVVSAIAAGLSVCFEIKCFDWQDKIWWCSSYLDIDFIIALPFFVLGSFMIKKAK